MRNGIRIPGILCALGIAMCAPGFALGESAAEAGWAKMTQCAAIADDKARHACTDEALRDAGLLEAKATVKRKAFGLQKPAPIAASPAAEAVAASPSSKKNDTEEVEVTLAKVEQGGDGKLVLTTSDGAVWHQVESGVVRQTPKQGETMKIEMRSLGGFMCQPSKYVSFRCYRSK